MYKLFAAAIIVSAPLLAMIAGSIEPSATQPEEEANATPLPRSVASPAQIVPPVSATAAAPNPVFDMPPPGIGLNADGTVPDLATSPLGPHEPLAPGAGTRIKD